MSSLTIVNKTLQQQNKILEDQQTLTQVMATSIDDVRERITEMLASQTSVYDALENARERPKFGPTGAPGGLPALPRPGGSTDENAAGLTAFQNFFNNVFGAMAGGAMGPMIAGAVGGMLGKTLKWGAIAFAADKIMNLVFENFDIPADIAEGIQGNVQRGLFAGFGASMLGLKGKWRVMAVAAGFFYDETNKLINWITENSEAAKAAMDYARDKMGIDLQGPLAGAAAFVGPLLAWEAGKRVVGATGRVAGMAGRGAAGLARSVPAALRAGATFATTQAPRVIGAAKSGARTALNQGMRGLSFVTSAAGAPVTAFAGTMAIFGGATMGYKDLLEQHPELAGINNGAGPGFVNGRYIVENGLIDEAIEESKRQGNYKLPQNRPTSQGAMSLNMGPSPAMPSFSGGGDAAAILDYLNSAPTPIVPTPGGTAERLRTFGPPPPQVVVVPVPTPAPAAPSGGRGGGTAIFTQPVPTTDRYDHRDRINRPY